MNKFLIIGLILVVIITIVILTLNKNKKNVVVLGQEIADASEKEKQRIEVGGYGKSPLPDYNYSKWVGEQSLINPKEKELDLAIVKLCNEFKNSNEAKRAELRRSISQDDIYTLMEFSKRVVLWGVRKKNVSYIYNGLIAVSMIETERCDYRDVWVAMSFLNYGIQKLNLNSSKILEDALRLSEPNTSKIIQSFNNGSSNNKSIEAIGGYTEIETPDGVGFIHTNYEEYHPEKSLVKLLLNVSDYLFNDKYLKGHITIGEEITSYWLSADKDPRIEKIISAASGCASLNTNLRSEFHPKANAQMLLIYLAEFKDQKSLNILIEQSNNTKPVAFSRLSFIEGDIFCLIIQRATWDGVDDFETNETLIRFELPIRALIR